MKVSILQVSAGAKISLTTVSIIVIDRLAPIGMKNFTHLPEAMVKIGMIETLLSIRIANVVVAETATKKKKEIKIIIKRMVTVPPIAVPMMTMKGLGVETGIVARIWSVRELKIQQAIAEITEIVPAVVYPPMIGTVAGRNTTQTGMGPDIIDLRAENEIMMKTQVNPGVDMVMKTGHLAIKNQRTILLTNEGEVQIGPKAVGSMNSAR